MNMKKTSTLHGVYSRYQSQMNVFQSRINAGMEDEFRELFDRSEEDLRLLLEVLYYGGRWIYADSSLDLTKLSHEEVREEFYKFSDQFLAGQGLSFGMPLSGAHLHVRDCQSSAWKNFILPAIDLL
ncbi:hypothetical protein [Porphyromonas bobii]|jgi:hypothetical protein|uniref:hypothetical protein n=1 Tax=Porphyromonas bobii TaxID=2811780 RepID=UPI001BFFF08B|nr:hypothetical protein [Porphyromonas bobii]